MTKNEQRYSSSDSGDQQGACRATPDCLKCMRQKLGAECVVVFSISKGVWQIDNYQGDRPSREAEVDFYCILQSGAPNKILERGGVLFNSSATVAEFFGAASSLLAGRSVIAAPVKKDDYSGIRLAWRELTNPFNEAELAVLKCVGDCPPGCFC